jgi:hypothetical protein
LLAGLLVAAVALPQRADAVPPLEDPPDCRPAIAVAERAEKLPRGLLGAMGRVETGRAGPDGQLQPWPWAVQANGKGSLHPTREAAIRHVKTLQRRGLRRIDAGCLQVNLMYHPQAFGSLEEAFSPEANARYAARFLRQLHGRSGSWMRAVALYHSARPDRGLAYRGRVEQALTGRTEFSSRRPAARQALAEPRGARASPAARRSQSRAGAARTARQTATTRAMTRQATARRTPARQMRQVAASGAGRASAAPRPARQAAAAASRPARGTVRRALAGPAPREARRPAVPRSRGAARPGRHRAPPATQGPGSPAAEASSWQDDRPHPFRTRARGLCPG